MRENVRTIISEWSREVTYGKIKGHQERYQKESNQVIEGEEKGKEGKTKGSAVLIYAFKN
jgi:hypothetical protein